MKNLWKEAGIAAVITLAVLTVLPCVLVSAVGSAGGMLVSVMLLLGVNPFFFLYLGMYGTKKRPGIAAGLILFAAAAFALGALAGFGMGADFVAVYAATYVLLAFAALGVTALVRRKKSKK